MSCSTPLRNLFDSITTFVFLVAIVVLLIRHIARSRDVTPTIILSSINGYLLLGVLGGALLAIAESIDRLVLAADAAGIAFPSQAPPGAFDYLYFSFVTLTTLGYGDVTPVSHLSRSMAILLAITGQLYMTILIAMLVGKFLARSEKR
jgi:voltage-gated potassium channel